VRTINDVRLRSGEVIRAVPGLSQPRVQTVTTSMRSTSSGSFYPTAC